MHEFSVAESILDVIEEAVGAEKGLTSVHLTLGTLSGICGEALEFCFTELAQQRGFGSPDLAIALVPAKVHCLDCGGDYECTDFYEGCPQCGSLNRDIASGYECNVDWVEVEEE